MNLEADVNASVAELIESLQASGRVAAVIIRPGEKIDTGMMKEYGVNLENLMVSKPETVKEAADMAKMLVTTDQCSVLYI